MGLSPICFVLACVLAGVVCGAVALSLCLVFHYVAGEFLKWGLWVCSEEELPCKGVLL